MVSRSLTEVFVLMRNNAIHSRQIFTEQHNTDSERVRLMRSSHHDLEGGMERPDSHAPPPWIDYLEEAHYIITSLILPLHVQMMNAILFGAVRKPESLPPTTDSLRLHIKGETIRLRTKLTELQQRHERQIRRPALDDSTDQQHIGRLASEIGRHFTHAHTQLTAIKAQIRHGNKTEQKLTANVVLALVTILQELSITFRTAQSNYLKTLTSREERSNAYFDLPNFEELSLEDESELLPGLTSNQTDLLFSLPSTSGTQRNINTYNDDTEHLEEHNNMQRQIVQQKQLLLLQEENTKMVAEREEEVNKIVRSIMDLNDIFKDLGQMVHEQGTVLDRIDYNIESTQVQVQEGLKQLQKAETYQRKNRKMHCILILAVMIVILAMLLIIVKS